MYYPIAIDLTRKKVLVVGGGKVAARKVGTLLEYGADVTVVSPQVEPEIEQLAQAGKITLKIKAYEAADMDGISVVIAATDDREINARVSEDAMTCRALVNVVDVPELCDFIVPATVKRGDLLLGIWTGGKSPALAKRIRKQLEAEFGPEYADLLDIMGELRETVKSKYPAQKDREAVFHKMLDSGILEMLKEGRKEEAREKALSCIS